jgi:hypothetical protein
MAGAAVAGLLTGSFTVRAYAASVSGVPGSSLHNLVDLDKGQHACKRQNDCKAQGGCNTGDNGRKGKGGCKTAEAAARAKTAAPPAEASRDWAIYRGLGLAQASLRPCRAGSVYHPLPRGFTPGFNLLDFSEQGPGTTNDQTILM